MTGIVSFRCARLEKYVKRARLKLHDSECVCICLCRMLVFNDKTWMNNYMSCIIRGSCCERVTSFKNCKSRRNGRSFVVSTKTVKRI